MADPEQRRGTDDLAERLEQARKRAGLVPDAAEADRGQAARDMSMGWRIAIELVTAVVVCTALGWVFDRWLGTKPWIMLAMLILGSAAGINNAVRTALRMDAEAQRRAAGGNGKGS